MIEQTPAIELRDLKKHYGKTEAVRGIDLVVQKGTTLGLLGPNGAGKSTTLKMLMGMLQPTSGSIRVLGRDIPVAAAEMKQNVGYVPEEHFIYRWMTVRETIRFAQAMYQSWNKDLAAELQDLFKLPDDRKVKGLSRGMLAKLSLLIALAPEPELIVLDEPLSGLDPIAREEFIEGVLRGICSGDRTILFSSHYLDEVNQLADSVAIMNSGRLMVHCRVEELLQSTRRVRAVLHDGKLPAKLPENTIWQRVNRREWLMTVYPCSDGVLEQIQSENPVDHVQVSELSLEDVFKDFVRGETVCSKV